MSEISKVVLIGDSNVGKTAIFQRVINGTFEEVYKPTISSGFSQLPISSRFSLGDKETPSRAKNDGISYKSENRNINTNNNNENLENENNNNNNNEINTNNDNNSNDEVNANNNDDVNNNNNDRNEDEEKSIVIGLWDTAGQEKFRHIIPLYFQNAKVVILIFDVTNVKSFEAVDEWANIIQEKAPLDALVYLIGNKIDLNDERKVDSDRIIDLGKTIGAVFSGEISAKSNVGIDILFQDIANRLIEMTSVGKNVDNFIMIDKENVEKMACVDLNCPDLDYSLSYSYGRKFTSFRNLCKC